METKKQTYSDIIAHYVSKGQYNANASLWHISHNHLQKLVAINKLLTTARYLNGNWKPDWQNLKEDKYYIFIGLDTGFHISTSQTINSAVVYFKSEGKAKKAIEILGEDTIRIALSTNW